MTDADRPRGTWISDEYDQRTFDTLCDLLDFAGLADTITNRGRDAYDEDVTLRLAAEAICHKMGEAAARLPSTFTSAQPQVDWCKIKGMRDVIAHQYGNVDHSILWNALVRDFPADAARIRELLNR